MKRKISLLLSLLLLLALLPACSQPAGEPDMPAPESEEPAAAARELAEAAFAFSGRGEELNTEFLNAGEAPDRLAVYIEAVCGLTEDRWEDAAVIRGTGASAFEILVLRLPDEAAAGDLEAVLTDYLTARQGAFTGYAPDEAEMASNGRVRREGQTVGLFICPDPSGAEDAFTAVYNGEALPEPPEPEPESEPSEEPFQPLFEIHDLLFRLLIEAACPEWGSVDKYWTTGDWKAGDTVASASGYWAPDDGNEWTAGGSVQIEYDEDNNPTVIQWGLEHMVSVSLMKSEEAALNALDSLTLTLNEQEENYRQRGDEVKAELIANARVAASGRYAALIISDHAEEAALLFSRAVNDPDTGGFFRRYIDGAQPAATADPDPDYPDRVRFTPPEEDMSIYDTSAILAAWEAGDPSGLSGDDREIYDAAEAILAETMQDGMTDLEKETAVYRWLVNNVDYDWSHQDVLEETARRAYGPYGGLVDRSAVCLGYAASFQLLMDMSGVECITIVGAAFNSTGDHAWNMVKLAGEWYCLDVTWDANGREQLGSAYAWRYFNITSDEMAKNHQWDYANIPEATSEDRGGAQ